MRPNFYWGPYQAQEYGFDIRLDRARVTPRHDVAEFQVWAWWTPSATWWRLQVAAFDLVASDLSSGFGWDCSPPPCMACPFHPHPTHGPGRLSGIGAIQSIIDPCPDNPIWTGNGIFGGSRDYSPRKVEIWIECEIFAVYDPAWEVTNLPDTHPHGFRDGRTTVYITDCEADMDWDGQLTFFDFLEFFNLYAAGRMDADCNGDEALNFEDFLCFQNDFAAGCP